MKILFWLSLAGILYTYAGYPLVIWALSRLRPRPWKAAHFTPEVSIVLAVHNGLDLLPRKIEHLLALDYANIKEIILVSDGSTDGTAEMLSSLQGSRIKTIILPEHGGKAVAVNAGVAAASAEILLFVDIRPEIAPGAIAELVSNFADSSIGCVAGELLLEQGAHDATSAAVGGLYWRYEQWIRKCESTFDSPVGVYGGFYAIRRSLATLQPAGIILDDMFQPLSIIRQGYRSVLDEAAVVYDKWPEKTGNEFHRKVRTLAGNYQLMQMAPWIVTPRNRVVFQLASHKLTRLASPVLLAMLLAASLAMSTSSAAFAVFAMAQMACYAVAALGLVTRIPIVHRLTGPAGAILVLNAAALVGLYKFVATRGPLWKIWNTGTPQVQPASHESVDAARPLTMPPSK